MRVRILSDLHIDVNKAYKKLFEWADKDVLTVIAGDTAGSLAVAEPFIRETFRNALLIGGNHIVYNREKKPLQDLYADYRAAFPLDSDQAFLENDYKIVEDAVFIGATLWTNYEFERSVPENMAYAFDQMNDFRWGYFRREDGKVVSLNPRHTLGMFTESLSYIKAVYDRFAESGKKLVLITHHGVSPKALSARKGVSLVNASYTSDLEAYISANLPRLSLIIHGHIHNRLRYRVGGTPVICNPCGYVDLGELDIGAKWEKNCIIEV